MFPVSDMFPVFKSIIFSAVFFIFGYRLCTVVFLYGFIYRSVLFTFLFLLFGFFFLFLDLGSSSVPLAVRILPDIFILFPENATSAIECQQTQRRRFC